MIFKTADEVEAYYAGRAEEADRWAWWEGGAKWCGVSDVRSLQDVLTDLDAQKERTLALSRKEKLYGPYFK